MQRVRELRLLRGMSQEDLGRAIGCTGSFISQVERGVALPQPRRLVKLAKVLGTTVEDLLADNVPDRASPRVASRAAGTDA
ncbi:MAG: helix-turn-helix transcriptional regulator [Actinomycetia bacterium]|nr:helix-turn-helix transcriptional regulator [Actinomycetes bacterium]